MRLEPGSPDSGLVDLSPPGAVRKRRCAEPARRREGARAALSGGATGHQCTRTRMGGFCVTRTTTTCSYRHAIPKPRGGTEPQNKRRFFMKYSAVPHCPCLSVGHRIRPNVGTSPLRRCTSGKHGFGGRTENPGLNCIAARGRPLLEHFDLSPVFTHKVRQ